MEIVKFNNSWEVKDRNGCLRFFESSESYFNGESANFRNFNERKLELYN